MSSPRPPIRDFRGGVCVREVIRGFMAIQTRAPLHIHSQGLSAGPSWAQTLFPLAPHTSLTWTQVYQEVWALELVRFMWAPNKIGERRKPRAPRVVLQSTALVALISSTVKVGGHTIHIFITHHVYLFPPSRHF